LKIDVELTEHESRICTWVGKQRYAYGRSTNRGRGLGASANADERYDVRGAHAEFAASIALNLYWRPNIGRLDRKDVGGLVETRSVDNPSFSLCIKPKDDDDDPFVLVLQLSPLCYRLQGWRFAGDVKRRYPLRTDRGDPAHFAILGELDGMETLLDWIANGR
jgi:hypothetical protein